MLPGGRRWDEPRRQSLLGNCLYNWCTTIAACTDFFCCCWLIRDCFGGRIGPRSGPPPPDPLLPPYPGPAGGDRFEQQPGLVPFSAQFGQPGPAPPQFGPSPLL